MTGGLELLAGLVMEDGRRWGEAAAGFQWADAEAILDHSGPRYHFLTRPRAASKTTDLAGVTLAVLEEAPVEAQLYAAAADRDQAALLVAEVRGFVRRTPPALWSDGPPTVETWKVTAHGGASLVALAADGPSAFGLRPRFLVVDELAQWASTAGPRLMWEALISAIVKVPGARLVALTTAGSPTHWSRKVLEHAASSPMWRVHEVPGPCPWIDPAVLDEQRRLLVPSAFARLHLNQWTAPEDRLTSRAEVLACVDHDGPMPPEPGRMAVVGVDLGLKRDRSVVAVCSIPRRGQRRVRVDRCDVWQATPSRPIQLDDIEAHVGEVARRYSARVVGDPWQAVAMYQRLRRAGLRVSEFTFTTSSWTRLAVELFGLLRDRGLDLPGDDHDLLDELSSVRLIERGPGVYRLDHDPGQHDDRVVAVALAANALLTNAPSAVVRVFSTAGLSLLDPGRPSRAPRTIGERIHI